LAYYLSEPTIQIAVIDTFTSYEKQIIYTMTEVSNLSNTDNHIPELAEDN